MVITRRAATPSSLATVTGYVDGVEQWQVPDSAGVAVINQENTLRFFRDNDTGGATNEHSAGAVARIRLFDRPLSATEVQHLGQTPSTPCTVA